MIPAVIAKRYATALLELGGETGELTSLVQEFLRASKAYEENAELRAVLDDPLVAGDAKKAIVDDVATALSLGAAARNALRLLLDRRRIRALPAIAARLSEMADRKRGVLRAEVVTAMPLPEEYFERLESELRRMTGMSVALDRRLDPSLLGGVVVRVGDTVYDGSLVARLKQMKETVLPN